MLKYISYKIVSQTVEIQVYVPSLCLFPTFTTASVESYTVPICTNVNNLTAIVFFNKYDRLVTNIVHKLLRQLCCLNKNEVSLT